MLNKKELLFIANLRKNCRRSLKQASIRSKIPITTLFDKLKKYENNFIIKHTTLVEFQKIGWNARAVVIVKVIKKDRERLEEYLMKHRAVNNLYRINNDHDFMFEIIFENLHQCEEFIEKLDKEFGIEIKRSYYILDDLKREDFLSDENYINLTQ